MKYLKMLGLAAIAALALMAFGAGTASATKLCTDSACTTLYPEGETLHSVLKKGNIAKLTSGGSTVAECEESTTHGTGTDNNTEWVVTHLSTLTWGKCNQTTHTVAPGTIEFMTVGSNQVVVRGQNTEVTLKLFNISCTYGTGAGTTLGTMTGGSAPIIELNTTFIKTAGSFVCPETVGWDVEYEIIAPHALFFG
jgi:hypothetical protein